MQSWPAAPIPALPGRGPELRLYDTSDRQVRPVAAGLTATMYVCGITPYDATHLGHAATYLAFDLIHRLWLDLGHDVHYVQNVTDVDDPLFERANRDGIDWRDLAAREVALYRDDMTALRVLPPREYVAATDAVAEVVELVEKMLASGAAYVVDDAEFPDVYYRADATLQFGYESGYDRDTMLTLFAERGGDPDRAGKSDQLDALLWRAERPGEPSWPSLVRPRPAGLARRVRGDRAQSYRQRPGHPGRGQRPDLPAPRIHRRARRIRQRGKAFRGALRARRHDRLGRPQDVQEPRQPGAGVRFACRGRGSRGHPAGLAGRALSRPTGTGGRRCWRTPTRACSGGEPPPHCPPGRTQPT